MNKLKCARKGCKSIGGTCRDSMAQALGCKSRIKPQRKEDALIYIVEELIGDLMIHLGHDRVERYMDRLSEIKKRENYEP